MMSRAYFTWFSLHLIALACVLLVVAAPSFGQGIISAFTGGDPGEGIDLDGNIVYAANLGPDFDAYVVQGVEFANHMDTDGVDVFFTNEHGTWAQPEYGRVAEGDGENDRQLEGVMRSIRWSGTPSAVEVSMDVVSGQDYKLQMMFTESCCDRGFDILVDDEMLAEDFAPYEHHLDWDGVGNWNIDNRDNGVARRRGTTNSIKSISSRR